MDHLQTKFKSIANGADLSLLLKIDYGGALVTHCAERVPHVVVAGLILGTALCHLFSLSCLLAKRQKHNLKTKESIMVQSV